MALATEVQTDRSFARYVDAARIQEVVRDVLLHEGRPACPPPPSPEATDVCGGAVSLTELTVLITDDERLRELNRRYRGVDSPTDVLAFGGRAEGFVEAPGAAIYLGDVVISYPHVLAQAEEQGHSPERELALLVIHGVLHLLGYDHTTPEEEAIMWARQEAILREVGHGWSAPRAASGREPGDQATKLPPDHMTR